MIVVDANVIAYLWLPDNRTAATERLLKKDSDWNAPFLWSSEFLWPSCSPAAKPRRSRSAERRMVSRVGLEK